MRFKKWLDTFVAEKGLEVEMIEVEGKSGMVNCIPLAVLIDHIKAAPKNEQAGIRTMLVKIDLVNGDVMDYFRHLAKAIAI